MATKPPKGRPAARRRPRLESVADVSRVTVVVCVGFLAGLLLSRPLWFDWHRLYPLAPVFARAPRLPPVMTLVLGIGIVLALAAAVFRLRPRARRSS